MAADGSFSYVTVEVLSRGPDYFFTPLFTPEMGDLYKEIDDDIWDSRALVRTRLHDIKALVFFGNMMPFMVEDYYSGNSANIVGRLDQYHSKYETFVSMINDHIEPTSTDGIALVNLILTGLAPRRLTTEDVFYVSLNHLTTASHTEDSAVTNLEKESDGWIWDTSNIEFNLDVDLVASTDAHLGVQLSMKLGLETGNLVQWTFDDDSYIVLRADEGVLAYKIKKDNGNVTSWIDTTIDINSSTTSMRSYEVAVGWTSGVTFGVKLDGSDVVEETFTQSGFSFPKTLSNIKFYNNAKNHSFYLH